MDQLKVQNPGAFQAIFHPDPWAPQQRDITINPPGPRVRAGH